MAAKKAVKRPRPVTRALSILSRLGNSLSFWAKNEDRQDFDELREILIRIDASTGKPDSARRRRPVKKGIR